MSSLLRMEFLKLAKRPMTWVLFALLHGGIGFGTVLSFLNLRGVPPDIRDSVLRDITLPGTLVQTGGYLYVFGTIMLAILAASSIGSEYSWGTLRPLLATGLPRGRFLAAKLLALACATLLFVLSPLAMNALLAIPIALLTDRPPLATPIDLPWLGDLAALIGRIYLILLVPTAVAFLVGLAGRSQAAGIGAALGLVLGEQIVGVLLLSLGTDWARTVVDALPGQNSRVLLNQRVFGFASAVPNVPSEGRSLAILTLYTLSCVLVGVLIFRRRDIRGGA